MQNKFLFLLPSLIFTAAASANAPNTMPPTFDQTKPYTLMQCSKSCEFFSDIVSRRNNVEAVAYQRIESGSHFAWKTNNMWNILELGPYASVSFGGGKALVVHPEQ